MNILVQACFYPYPSDVCAPLSVPEAERALYPILSHELSLLHRRPLTSDESNAIQDAIDLTSPQREKSPMTYMPVTRTLSLLGCSQREIRYILENLTSVVNTPLGHRLKGHLCSTIAWARHARALSAAASRRSSPQHSAPSHRLCQSGHSPRP